MGQYYKVCNIDKGEYLDAHSFGDGLKLLEFGASGGGTMLGLAILLAHGSTKEFQRVPKLCIQGFFLTQGEQLEGNWYVGPLHYLKKLSLQRNGHSQRAHRHNPIKPPRTLVDEEQIAWCGLLPQHRLLYAENSTKQFN